MGDYKRNGHQLHDFYDPDANALDMRTNGLYPSKSLKGVVLVVFSHGKESGPLGSKIQRLMAVAEELGLEAKSIDYRDCSCADERVAKLTEYLSSLDIPLNQVALVGSSMGGYVSMAIANEMNVAGLFLMAPALWMNKEEYTIQSYRPKAKNIEIVHGMHDDTVPYENSVRFAKEHDGTVLHLVPDGHRLQASHDFLDYQFRRYLKDVSKQS